MFIDALIEQLSKNEGLKVRKSGGEISVSTNRNGRILRIYPELRRAEFIDIEDEWDELRYALEEKYPQLPELEKLRRSMSESGYDITW